MTNFPLPRRGAYFALRISSARRLWMNLKDSPRGTQYSKTRSRIRSALSSVADTWIFQPWAGRVSSAGAYTSQSSSGSRVQPAGTGRRAAGYCESAVRALVTES